MEKVIIACDFQTREELEALLEGFGQRKLFLKIGMEIFYREGRKLVEDLKAQGHQIFLDLKLHDIPNTVASAIRNLRDLNVDFLTIHAQGGKAMMQAAVDAVEGSQTKILAVSILTSLDQEAIENDLHIHENLQEYVVHLAKLSASSNVHGLICSAQEARKIKEACGEAFYCVTPGIRLANNSVDDQKRVMTPERAIEEKADYLVIGRAITAAENPAQTYDAICQSIQSK